MRRGWCCEVGAVSGFGGRCQADFEKVGEMRAEKTT